MILFQAYRKLAKEFHPDKNPTEGEKVISESFNLFNNVPWFILLFMFQNAISAIFIVST